MNQFALVLSCLLSWVSSTVFGQESDLCKRSVLPHISHIPGWCSEKKGSAMIDLIFEIKPYICVEIGVFAGASILPTAYALKYLNKGFVYAVDSWNTYECTKYYPDGNPHKDWWSKVDFNYIYNSFFHLLKSHDLQKQCIVLAMTSEDAAPLIPTIDILHIDSTHCDESALQDLFLYFPKVRIGGYIWFTGWANTPNAFEYIKQNCQVKKVLDDGQCILLKKESNKDCL